MKVADTGSFMTVSFQCLTLESRKLNFTPGNKNWIPVSSTGMTPS
ncbi:hypothetical protein [Wolbachia endosymbiont (group A) of Brachyopa scutellaris]